mgnify:FL=1
MSYRIEVVPEFARRLKNLSKRYRHIIQVLMMGLLIVG